MRPMRFSDKITITMMFHGWYSTSEVALNLFKFVYRFERARITNGR